MYAVPHDHSRWPDHVMRVKATIDLGKDMLAARLPRPQSVVIADLSCGDGTIARALSAYVARSLPDIPARVILGDLAPGWEMHGPVESTIEELTHVDLIVCTETVEHLEDPDAVLRRMRAKAGLLILSTPDDETPGINREHLWTWDQDGVREMLAAAWWQPFMSRTVTWEDGNGWKWAYQIWGCE